MYHVTIHWLLFPYDQVPHFLRNKTMVLSIFRRLCDNNLHPLRSIFKTTENDWDRKLKTKNKKKTELPNYKLVISGVVLNQILKYYVPSWHGSCVKFLIFREKKTMAAFIGTVSYMTDDLSHLCVIKTVGVAFVALLICWKWLMPGKEKQYQTRTSTLVKKVFLGRVMISMEIILGCRANSRWTRTWLRIMKKSGQKAKANSA